jgi:putative methyltransferase (TIGR04325 family)
MLINYDKFFYYIKKILRLSNSYEGSFSNWDECLALTKSYKDKSTIESIKKNFLYSKNKKFYDNYQDYSNVNLSLLICKLYYSSKRKIKILDWGGGAGNLYDNFHKMLINSKVSKKFKFNWDIFEQNEICTYSLKFKKKNLNYYNLNNFDYKKKYDIIIISASLEFFKEPCQILKNLKKNCLKFLIVDRSPFKKKDDGKNHLTICKAANFSRCSYPCWILSLKRIRSILGNNFGIIYRFKSLGGVIYGKFGKANYQGVLFMRTK